MRDLANCLIEQQKSSKNLRTENEATLVVLENMRPQLEELMGDTGYRALLMNALARAKTEVPWLGEARINRDGSFDGFDEGFSGTGLGQSTTGGAVMLAWFFDLLTSFLGELLTFQLVLEVWPDLSLKNCFTMEGNHEKAH